MMLSGSRLVRSQLRTISQRQFSSKLDWGTPINGALIQNADYKANLDAMQHLVTNLEKTVLKVQEGGGARACAKHKSRNKLLARERINGLVDVGSPFLEMSPLAGHGKNTTFICYCNSIYSFFMFSNVR